MKPRLLLCLCLVGASLGCEPTRVTPSVACSSSAHCRADGKHFCDLTTGTYQVCTGSLCASVAADASGSADAATFPIFQDADAVKAKEAMGGTKDDIFIYDSTGKLAHFLPVSGTVDTDLSGAGYAVLKKLVLATK